MRNRRPTIIGYRTAIVRPYGPTGEDVEVTPVGERRYADRAQAELAAVDVPHAVVIELRRGGRSSVDPGGRPVPPRWQMTCGDTPLNGATFTTWPAAAAAIDRERHDSGCDGAHHIITRDLTVHTLVASATASG